MYHQYTPCHTDLEECCSRVCRGQLSIAFITSSSTPNSCPSNTRHPVKCTIPKISHANPHLCVHLPDICPHLLKELLENLVDDPHVFGLSLVLLPQHLVDSMLQLLQVVLGEPMLEIGKWYNYTMTLQPYNT